VLRKCQSVRWSADVEGLGSLAHRLAGPSLRAALQPVPPLLAHPRYGHPLRFYITPHRHQWPPVTTQAPFGGSHRLRALRVKATGVMQCGLRWRRSQSPYGCACTVASVRRCALCSWLVACGQSCGVCPRPPLCFAAARHQPCALVCSSFPRRAPSARAPTLLAFAIGFVARHARNTRAKGLAACKPAWPLADFFSTIVVVIDIYLIAACARSTRAIGRFGL
jgi:hypothetical protein